MCKFLVPPAVARGEGERGIPPRPRQGACCPLEPCFRTSCTPGYSSWLGHIITQCQEQHKFTAVARNSASRRSRPAHPSRKRLASDPAPWHTQSGNQLYTSDCHYYPGCSSSVARQKCLC